jgi:NADH-quinone oxidoreductase subunit M
LDLHQPASSPASPSEVTVVPFHTWLPDAHVEAPTAISMMLAGILLEDGRLRVLPLLLPARSEETTRPRTFVKFIAILGLINLVYGALCAMARRTSRNSSPILR